MAKDEENLSTDQKVRRSVRKTLGWAAGILVVLGVAVVWGSFGAFTLEEGRAAVVLRFGEHHRTITTPGFHLALPPPFDERVVIDVSQVRNEDFGFRGREDENTPLEKVLEATMQTGDNNIVRASFAVQYTVKDAFMSKFRVARPEQVVRDAAQAAMRQVVARMTVDQVLREQRALVSSEASRLLQDILDSYESGIAIEGVQLQDVRPPAPVRAAFDSLMESNQDASRVINEAEGYRNEVLPRARGEAAEVMAQAEGYRDALVAEATGEAARFTAVVAEYQKAPEVTRKRLYLETMEQVLPDVDKIVIESGTTQVLPYLPLDRRREGAQ
jgi:membrane protease subunit HflK